jgi:hypothetical protein
MSRPRADYYKCSRSSASARLYCMVVSQCEACTTTRVLFTASFISSQKSRSDVPRRCALAEASCRVRAKRHLGP